MQIYLKDGNQYVLQKMQTAGFNVTTCGNCGGVVLHLTGAKCPEELTCEYCGFTGDISDFPDLRVVEEADILEHVTVQYEGETYELYDDGTVYHTSCDHENDPDGHDIPELIFNLRDTYVKEK